MVLDRNDRRSGLTLLEVLLVVTIIVMLGAVAYPTLDAMYGDVRVKAAADQVRGACTEARARAIEDVRGYRLSVQPGSGKYRVAPHASEFWDGSGSEGMGEEVSVPAFILEEELTKPIVFKIDGDFPTEGEWTTIAIFNPDGTCSADVEITLKEDDDSSPLIVRIRSMTGAVSVRKKRSEGR